jgi:toxin-antitoxin system PIN domain toxin
VIAPDVNVLIYALRHELPQHAAYRAWLDQSRDSPEPLILFEPVMASVIRITTNSRIYPNPTKLTTLEHFFAVLLASPSCRGARAGDHHWNIFLDLCRKANCHGNLVPDAYLAALAIEHNCDWITADRDFARFPGLRWRHPLQ